MYSTATARINIVRMTIVFLFERNSICVFYLFLGYLLKQLATSWPNTGWPNRLAIFRLGPERD